MAYRGRTQNIPQCASDKYWQYQFDVQFCKLFISYVLCTYIRRSTTTDSLGQIAIGDAWQEAKRFKKERTAEKLNVSVRNNNSGRRTTELYNSTLYCVQHCPSGAVLVRAKSPSHVRSVVLVLLSVWRHHLGPFWISTNKLKCTVFFFHWCSMCLYYQDAGTYMTMPFKETKTYSLRPKVQIILGFFQRIMKMEKRLSYL